MAGGDCNRVCGSDNTEVAEACALTAPALSAALTQQRVALGWPGPVVVIHRAWARDQR